MTTSKPLFKVICIKNSGALRKNETYEVFEAANMLGKDCYYIAVNSKYIRMMWFDKSFFATQAEWRDKQINSILND
jgi:hypothetical protein